MSENLTPVFRLEHFIKAAADGTPCDLTPVFNEEKYLHKIAGGIVDALPVPVGRFQEYLANIAGMDIEVPEPVFREEFFLAAIAGMDVEVPNPIFREELFLAEWVESGGGSVVLTVSGVSPLSLINAVAHSMISLTQYGKCVQDGTPTPSDPVGIVCNNGRVVAGNCISSIPDGQGTFITPSESNTTRIYKAFPTGLIAGRSYTVTVTGANWSFIVQRKKPDGTDWSNVSAWVTTYEFVPEAGYIYGIALRIGGGTATITPADFNGTLSLDTTDGKPWADGTPEVLTVGGINLFDPTCITQTTVGGITINAPTEDGVITASGTTEITYEQFVFMLKNPLPAGKYTVSLNNSPALGNGSLVGFGVGGATVGDRGTGLKDTNSSKVITIPEGSTADRIVIRLNGDLSAWSMKIQIEAGEVTPSAYQPYVAPQTVNNVSNLLAVGDYADTEELIAGIKTGKVGMKVLTGDNTKDGLWGTSAGASNLYSLTISDSSKDNSFSPISTHFVGILGSVGYASIQDGQFKHGSNANTYFFKDTSSEDVTAFKAFLASEYAAGHPVIVIYPLATETTEQTTTHALHTAQGTNVVSVTAEVSDISLTAEYKGTEAP